MVSTLVLVFLMAVTCLVLKFVPKSSWSYYVNLIAFGASVQFGFLLPFIFFPFRPFDHRNAGATANLVGGVQNLLGLKYKLTGVENLRAAGGIVLINHQSFWDLVVLSYIWPHLGPVAVIAKKELIYYFPVGPAIWSYGSVFIDRSNRQAALKSIERASQAIHRDKKKLIFFPEGTRSGGSDTLLPFKNGAFASAFDNQCNVYPVVVSQFKFLDHKRKLFTPGTGRINILEPVNAKDFGSLAELRDHCQVVMQKEYDRLKEERDL